MAQSVKNPPRFDPWVGKISQRRKWQCTSVLLPGEFHVQRSLAGYRPWDHKELDMTEQLSTHTRERQEMTWLSLWEVSSLVMKKGGKKRSIVARYDIYFKIGVKMLWKHSGERNNEICSQEKQTKKPKAAYESIGSWFVLTSNQSEMIVFTSCKQSRGSSEKLKFFKMPVWTNSELPWWLRQ